MIKGSRPLPPVLELVDRARRGCEMSIAWLRAYDNREVFELFERRLNGDHCLQYVDGHTYESEEDFTESSVRKFLEKVKEFGALERALEDSGSYRSSIRGRYFMLLMGLKQHVIKLSSTKSVDAHQVSDGAFSESWYEGLSYAENLLATTQIETKTGIYKPTWACFRKLNIDFKWGLGQSRDMIYKDSREFVLLESVDPELLIKKIDEAEGLYIVKPSLPSGLVFFPDGYSGVRFSVKSHSKWDEFEYHA